MRAAAMIAWFGLLVAPLHFLLSALGRRDLVPPPFLASLGWLCGLRVRTVGRPAAGKLLMVANHVSWLDILALGGATRTAFVAHGGLAEHGFLKWLCDQNDTEFIARERRGTVGHQVAQVRGALARRRLTIFPEATTGDGTALLPFKSSLLSAVEAAQDVTIQPVAMNYRDAAEIAWIGSERGIDNALRILARTRPVRLTIHFLEPLPEPTVGDRKAMAASAEAAIARALAL